MPTIPQTQTILESYFQTTDVPTADQFTEFIGTMFYLFNQMVSLANTIETEFTTLEALINNGVPTVICAGTASGPAFFGTQTGVSGVMTGTFGSINTLVITFSVPFANTNYRAVPSGNAVYVLAQTVNTITLALPATLTGGGFFGLVVWA